MSGSDECSYRQIRIYNCQSNLTAPDPDDLLSDAEFKEEIAIA